MQRLSESHFELDSVLGQSQERDLGSLCLLSFEFVGFSFRRMGFYENLCLFFFKCVFQSP